MWLAYNENSNSKYGLRYGRFVRRVVGLGNADAIFCEAQGLSHRGVAAHVHNVGIFRT